MIGSLSGVVQQWHSFHKARLQGLFGGSVQVAPGDLGSGRRKFSQVVLEETILVCGEGVLYGAISRPVFLLVERVHHMFGLVRRERLMWYRVLGVGGRGDRREGVGSGICRHELVEDVCSGSVEIALGLFVVAERDLVRDGSGEGGRACVLGHVCLGRVLWFGRRPDAARSGEVGMGIGLMGC